MHRAGLPKEQLKELSIRLEGKKELILKKEKPFNPKLRTHKLTGRLEGLWAFSVSYDHRVIFKFLKEDEILLIDIGTHDEVY